MIVLVPDRTLLYGISFSESQPMGDDIYHRVFEFGKFLRLCVCVPIMENAKLSYTIRCCYQTIYAEEYLSHTENFPCFFFDNYVTDEHSVLRYRRSTK